MPPQLETERLILRGYRASDLDAWAAMCADPAVMEFLSPVQTRGRSKEIAERLQTSLDRNGYGWWVVEIKGGAPFAGYVALQNIPFETTIDPPFEVGWRFAREHWGRGYASEGGARLLRFAFDELDRPEVVAMTAAINVRSQAVMRRLSMTHDPAENFENPRIAVGNRLRPHVLYRKRRG